MQSRYEEALATIDRLQLEQARKVDRCRGDVQEAFTSQVEDL